MCLCVEDLTLLSLTCLQQVPGITDRGLTPRKIAKVAILGGGLMGSGIATALLLSNYPVILKEVNEKFLNAGIDRVKGRYGTNLKSYGVLPNTGVSLYVLFQIPICLFCHIYFPANLQSRVRKGKMTKEKCEKTLSLLTGVLDYESFKDVDLVIEVSSSFMFSSFRSILTFLLC